MRIGVVMPMAVQPDTGQLPSWARLRDFALHAEAVGVHSLWVFDHFYDLSATTETGAIHEAWSLQSALAAVTGRAELGQLVLCTPLRHPALLAKMAVTADHVSGGRLTLGLGAGWYEREHHDLGLPVERRVDRFSEYCDVVLPLLRGETVTVEGRHHRVSGAALSPAPERRVPVLVAGHGPRMLSLVARHADAWNTAWYRTADDRLAGRMADMRAALAAAGREPSSLRWTAGMLAPEEGDDYPAALASFAEQGIDDVIVLTDTADPASLDRLAAAGAPWLS